MSINANKNTERNLTAVLDKISQKNRKRGELLQLAKGIYKKPYRSHNTLW